MEACVCAWLLIDHMVLTRVASGRMTAGDDELIQHHMLSAWGFLSLAVSCSCFRASPRSVDEGGSILKVSQAPVEAWGGDHTQHSYQVLVTLWMRAPPAVPRIPPLQGFLCAIQQQCYLSVSTSMYLYIHVCLGGGEELRYFISTYSQVNNKSGDWYVQRPGFRQHISLALCSAFLL